MEGTLCDKKGLRPEGTLYESHRGLKFQDFSIFRGLTTFPGEVKPPSIAPSGYVPGGRQFGLE